jgi:hypothetical protein
MRKGAAYRSAIADLRVSNLGRTFGDDRAKAPKQV